MWELTIPVLSGFVLALFAPLIHRVVGRRTGWVLAALPFILAVHFFRFIPQIARGETVRTSLNWASDLGITLSFYLDGLSLLFALLVCVAGTLVFIYAGRYLYGHPLLGRYFAYKLVFMASMIGLVLADNLILLFIFWEITSVSSYLLIGFSHELEGTRQAARQALLVTALGGVALLAGFILLNVAGGSFELTTLFHQGHVIKSHSLATAILVLIVIGAFTKSAQFPFHFWLPSAMVAPAPVSAFLHSATMVKAGIYLLARFNPFLGGTDAWHYLLTIAGAVTGVVGVFLALADRDAKKLLAYTTVSALGIMVFMLGLSTTLAANAAIVFLLVHALYKGALFLGFGAVDHATGTRDVTVLGGLYRYMPVMTVIAVIACLSMAGMPPLIGFIGKELVYEAKMQAPQVGLLLSIAGMLTAVLIVTVATILGLKVFFGKARPMPYEPMEPPFEMLLGPAVFSILGLLFGIFPSIIADSLVGPAVDAIRAEETTVKLALWHGLNPVFMLSIGTIIAGLLIYCLRRWTVPAVRWVCETLRFGPEYLYYRSMDALTLISDVQTRLLQNGRLRYYASIIFVTAFGLIGFMLFRNTTWFTPPPVANIPFYAAAVALFILGAGLFAIITSSRLAAAMALGAVGYGIALIYVIYSAPDLAITQILVETLTVIIFVLVVYRLPRFLKMSSTPARIRDAVISLGAGAVVTALVWKAGLVQIHTPISSYFLDNSLLKAYGQNVVNTILVDFRALDTFGEITVLAVAAFGVYALLKLKLKAGEENQ